MQPELTDSYLLSQGLSKTFPQRFRSKVKKTESCWLWTHSVSVGGYGQIARGGSHHKPIVANRASWILNRGPIPEGFWVLHDCPGGDNPCCVNPDHLWLGTHEDNWKDALKKGAYEKGENKVPRKRPEKRPPVTSATFASKLSQQDVLEIRKLWENGNSQPAIGKQFGITQSHVSEIIHGKHW